MARVGRRRRVGSNFLYCADSRAVVQVNLDHKIMSNRIIKNGFMILFDMILWILLRRSIDHDSARFHLRMAAHRTIRAKCLPTALPRFVRSPRPTQTGRNGSARIGVHFRDGRRKERRRQGMGRRVDEVVFAAYGWSVAMSNDDVLAGLLALNVELS